MTPRLMFVLAVLGVAAAGVPLLWLTRPALPAGGVALAPAAGSQVPQADGAVPGRVAVYARVQFTGVPRELMLLVQGEPLAVLGREGGAAGLPEPGVWEVQLMLPAPLVYCELEVQGRWDAGAPQAVTVTLEPPRQPARCATVWALPEGVLYDCCVFDWQEQAAEPAEAAALRVPR